MTRQLSMMSRIRLGLISLGVLDVSVVIAAQVEPPARVQGTLVADDPEAAAKLEAMQNAFGTSGVAALTPGGLSTGDLPERIAVLKAALQEPIKRAEVREQRVPEIFSSYPGLAQYPPAVAQREG